MAGPLPAALAAERHRTWEQYAALLAAVGRRAEHSHPGFRPYAHSHIKLIAAHDWNKMADR